MKTFLGVQDWQCCIRNANTNEYSSTPNEQRLDEAIRQKNCTDASALLSTGSKILAPSCWRAHPSTSTLLRRSPRLWVHFGNVIDIRFHFLSPFLREAIHILFELFERCRPNDR